MKNKFLLAIMFACTMQASFAQRPPSYIQQGNQQFELKNYYEAAQFYEQFFKTEKYRTPRMAIYAVQKNGKRQRSARNYMAGAMYKLAESYRQIHDYKKAEIWYKEAGQHLKDSSAPAHYWQAVCMRANEKYTEAEEMLAKLSTSNKVADQIKTNANRELKNLQFIKEEMNKQGDNYTVEFIRDSMHTSSYALAIQKENNIVFTGISKQNIVGNDSSKKVIYTNGLYTTDNGADFANRGRQVRNDQNNEMHEGMANFSADGKRMYFTRWYKKEGNVSSAIYLSERMKDGEWDTPIMLDDKINMANYNAAEPFITDDGKFLLFSSDRPGGIGKYDLWSAQLDAAGKVLSVQNMGAVINTADDEFSPYFHLKSHTLVFSSNGRVGMGGFDIYSSEGNIASMQWQQPVNPGATLNSSKDDIFFTSTDKISCFNTGYISSDRNAEQCCLALYAVKQNNSLQVNGIVLDKETQQPLAGVIIHASDPQNSNHDLQSVVTDEQGKYRFTVRNVSSFDIVTEKDAYERDVQHISHQLKAGEDTLQNEAIGLNNTTTIVAKQEEIKTDDEKNTEELNNLIYNAAYVGSFEFGKSDLNNFASANLDSLAILMNRYPDAKVQLSGYTDNFGSSQYNLKLAERRVDACIQYLAKKGIDKNRLVNKALGACCPLQAETKANGKDDPNARRHNRRVEYIFLQ